MKALIFGLGLGVASTWLPHVAVEPMARLVVPAVALLATSIFPCMSLAVGSLKAEQRDPSQVDELYTQLKIIMKVLVATFALAVTAVVCIVGLSGLITIIAPVPGANGASALSPAVSLAIELAIRTLLIVVCIVLALLGGRVLAVGKAFFAILDINRKHALLVARSRVQNSREKALEGARKENFAPDSKEPRALERA